MNVFRPLAARQKPTAYRFFAAVLLSVLVQALSLASFDDRAAARPLDEATAVTLGLETQAVDDLLEGRRGVALGALKSARAWRNPELEFEREGVDGFGGQGAENRVTISQPLDVSGYRGLQTRAAEKRVGAAESDADAYLRDRRAAVRLAFHDAIHQVLAEDAQRRYAENLGDLEIAAQRRVAAGDASVYDLKRIERETASAAAGLSEAEAERLAAWRRLMALVDPSDQEGFQAPKGDLAPQDLPEIEDLLAGLSGRGDLKALAQRADAFDLERRAARRGAFSDITLGIGVRRFEGGPVNSTGLVLSASAPLPLLNRGGGEAMSKAGEARASRAEYALALAEAEGALRALWGKASALKTAARDFRAKGGAKDGDLRSIARAAYGQGEIGVLELIDAERTALEAEMRALDLEWRARAALIELERVSGGEPL